MRNLRAPAAFFAGPGFTFRGGQVNKILETHRFGPHRVDVLEQADDEGTSYVVAVDGAVVTHPPLEVPPTPEDVVRLYARSQGQA